MPTRPPAFNPLARLEALGIPKHKPSRQQGRFLHTGSKQWRAIRKAQLERFPICEDCDQPAIEVDHNTNDTSRNEIGVELSSLCKVCHSRRTYARQHGRTPRIVGCDVEGWPLDPGHHWNEKSPAD